MNRSNVIKSLVVLFVVIVTLFVSCDAKAAKPKTLEECVVDAEFKGYVRAGVYGGVLLGGATALGLAVAPAAVPAGAFL